jgi:pimeloyl-ACP methyl ester carboxylesterase
VKASVARPGSLLAAPLCRHTPCVTTPYWRLPDPRDIKVLGHRIRYWDAGKGDPIVLVPGFSGSAIYEWGPVFEPLARRHRVVALQVIGFAPSEQPEIAYTTEELVNHLGEFMRALGLEKITLIGESFGGWHAAAYATKAAALKQPPIAKLVLVDAAICMKGPPAANARGFVSAVLQAESDKFSATFPPSNEDFKLQIVRDSGLFRGDPSRDDLAAIAEPTLLLWGEKDEMIPLDCGEDAASLIPNARLIVLPNVGHIPSIEAPDDFVRVVSGFASS